MPRDRRDGVYLKNVDPMHIFTPIIMPGRCNNEAYISETIDLAKVDEYLAKKNAEAAESDDPFKWTVFHLLVTTMLRVLTLRPKMNRFYASKKLYQHKDISAAFVVKKYFDDEAEEGFANVKAKPTDTIHEVRERMRSQIYIARSDHEKDTTSESMDSVGKFPFPILHFVAWLAAKLDAHGKAPHAFVDDDVFQNSVVLSNIGSLGMKAGYHHLCEWGCNSVFVTMGKMEHRPIYNEETGEFELHHVVDLGITIDERIADGYYYAKSIRLLKKLMENPELLEQTMDTEVDY